MTAGGSAADKKQIPRTASRARENRGKGKSARDSARDDNVGGSAEMKKARDSARDDSSHDGAGAGDTGIEFWGNSFVADPFGQVIAEASNDKEEVLVVECDPAKSEDTRRNWPFLRDRRIDAYQPILSRWLEK
jgi:predicted amidohydrolase